jgi:hypothetical protein
MVKTGSENKKTRGKAEVRTAESESRGGQCVRTCRDNGRQKNRVRERERERERARTDDK